MPRTFLVIIALITGLIFFAGSTTPSAAASKPQASKKSSWKKPHSKKRQGVTGFKKNRRVAETKHEEKTAGNEDIIARPA